MADSRAADFTTILGPDAAFKGDLSFDSAAKLQGRVEGSIKSKGLVLIADGSTCKATVKAAQIAVEGHVVGNVEATERVEIKKSGRISGDIIAARMTMADGASIEGHVQIGLEGKAASAKASVTAEPKVSQAQTAKAR